MRQVLLILLSGLISLSALAKELNVYNWSDFIPNRVLHQFEKETGIKVNYSNYDSNEALFAKLKATDKPTYDVIFPSNYFVTRMKKLGMLERLDLTQLKNRGNLDPRFMNLTYDPHNEYSLPFLWSTTAILVNKKYIDPTSVRRWADLWQPRFKNQLLLLDDTRDVFSTALISEGLSINTTEPEKIKQAYLALVKLLPNARLFNSIAQTNIYIDEDVHIGMVWSGGASIAHEENPSLVYVYPQDGFVIDLDCMAIPKGAPHKDAAYQFIDFILRADVAKQIIEFSHFMAPNVPAQKLMPPSLQQDRIINPDAQTLKRGRFVEDIGDAIAHYEYYWQRLKVIG